MKFWFIGLGALLLFQFGGIEPASSSTGLVPECGSLTPGLASQIDLSTAAMTPSGSVYSFADGSYTVASFDGAIVKTVVQKNLTSRMPFPAVAATNGNVWSAGSHDLAIVSPRGVLKTIPLDSTINPQALAADSMGNAWILSRGTSLGDYLIEVSPQGLVTLKRNLQSYGLRSTALSVGEDDSIWVTFASVSDTPGGAIGHFEKNGASELYPIPFHGYPTEAVTAGSSLMFATLGNLVNNAAAVSIGIVKRDGSITQEHLMDWGFGNGNGLLLPHLTSDGLGGAFFAGKNISVSGAIRSFTGLGFSTRTLVGTKNQVWSGNTVFRIDTCPFLQTSIPKVKTASKSRVAIADTGIWDDGVGIRYQWLRDGKTIKGANQAGYSASKSDRKHQISLEVTAFKFGFTTQTFVSNKVKI